MKTTAINTREQAVKEARSTLNAAGYHCVASHILRETDGKTKCGDMWIYVGHGEQIILKTIFIPQSGVVGWDVFTALCAQSNSVADTLEAIRARNKAAA